MEVRRRMIRISFSDPDATDSDSDSDSGEDASSASCGKRIKIVILHCGSSSSAKKKNPGGCCCSQHKQAIRSPSAASCRERAVGSAPMKRCRGVYERQPGRWAAEFRSHRLKARHWIGTFATEEEAKAAYDDFERRFVLSRRCGPPLPLPALERGRAAGVHCRPSHPHGPHRQRHPHPSDETDKRQIVQALTATGVTLPPLPSASAPCVSNSTSASPPPPLVPAGPPTPPFENAELHADDALPSVHSFWADEPADEDLVGLADLGHLPLPFSDGTMDFDPDDLSLFDGFL